MDRVSVVLAHAAELAGTLRQPEAAAAELLALEHGAALRPQEEIRVGLTLASLYEHELRDPGRALAELRRLIDRHPQLRQTVQLRKRLAELRARNSAARLA